MTFLSSYLSEVAFFNQWHTRSADIRTSVSKLTTFIKTDRSLSWTPKSTGEERMASHSFLWRKVAADPEVLSARARGNAALNSKVNAEVLTAPHSGGLCLSHSKSCQMRFLLAESSSLTDTSALASGGGRRALTHSVPEASEHPTGHQRE